MNITPSLTNQPPRMTREQYFRRAAINAGVQTAEIVAGLGFLSIGTTWYTLTPFGQSPLRVVLGSLSYISSYFLLHKKLETIFRGICTPASQAHPLREIIIDSQQKTDEEKVPFFDLPNEAWEQIFEKFDRATLLALRRTCSSLHELIDLYLNWEEICQEQDIEIGNISAYAAFTQYSSYIRWATDHSLSFQQVSSQPCTGKVACLGKRLFSPSGMYIQTYAPHRNDWMQSINFPWVMPYGRHLSPPNYYLSQLSIESGAQFHMPIIYNFLAIELKSACIDVLACSSINSMERMVTAQGNLIYTVSYCKDQYSTKPIRINYDIDISAISCSHDRADISLEGFPTIAIGMEQGHVALLTSHGIAWLRRCGIEGNALHSQACTAIVMIDWSHVVCGFADGNVLVLDAAHERYFWTEENRDQSTISTSTHTAFVSFSSIDHFNGNEATDTSGITTMHYARSKLFIGRKQGQVQIVSDMHHTDTSQWQFSYVARLESSSAVTSLLYSRGLLFCGYENGTVSIVKKFPTGTWRHIYQYNFMASPVRGISVIGDKLLCGTEKGMFVSTAYTVDRDRCTRSSNSS